MAIGQRGEQSRESDRVKPSNAQAVALLKETEGQPYRVAFFIKVLAAVDSRLPGRGEVSSNPETVRVKVGRLENKS